MKHGLRKKTLRKRGGRISSSHLYSRRRSPSLSHGRRSRSQSPSLSPGRITIMRSQPIHNEGNRDQPAQDEPIVIERWNYKVRCNNGDEHTSLHEYTRRDAKSAAREYCSTRGDVSGRIEYTSLQRMI